jgi:hypothetical protein
MKAPKSDPKEPHHFGGDRAGMRCGSCSDGSGSKINEKHRLIKCPKLEQQFLLLLLTFLTISIVQNSKDKVAPTLDDNTTR